MPKPRVSLPLSLFTPHEASEDSSTVSNELLCNCAEMVANQFAHMYRWREGAGDLLAWAWEALKKLRDRGVPARAWGGALAFDFIDMLRVVTNWRSAGRDLMQRTSNFAVVNRVGYNESVSHGDNGVDLITVVVARRNAPDTVEQVLSDFERELGSLNERERAIIHALARGQVLREIGEALNLSESRVSQMVSQICERFHGRYQHGAITSNPETPARIAHRNRMLDRAREKLSEKSDATG